MEENRICDICGAVIEDDSWTFTSDGKCVCEACRDDEYTFCECCNEYVPNDEINEVNRTRNSTVYICDDCCDNSARYFFCEDCEEWYDGYNFNEFETNDGRTICDNCYENNYETCPDCNQIFLRDDMWYDEDEIEYYCSDCADEHKHKECIKNYSYKPSPKFKSMTLHDRFIVSSDIKELTLGVELEIDKGHDRFDCAEELVDASEDIYCKEDGSLSCGIEIVSHPCTLGYHLEGLGWDKLIEIAQKYDYKSHDARTCGLHIHVGREQLGKYTDDRRKTITKIMMLVIRHWTNMVSFSRREEGQISRWAAKPAFNVSDNEDATVSLAMDTVRAGRYQAINLQNSNTIEFRLFNGTLKKETLFATLQLVSNICEYAKAHSFADVKVSSWNDIQHFVEYAELNEYCEGRINPYIAQDFPRGFVMGDKVKVTMSDILRGITGTIVEINSRSEYGVDFSSMSADAMTIINNYGYLHNCSGCLRGNTGRYYAANYLELVEE